MADVVDFNYIIKRDFKDANTFFNDDSELLDAITTLFSSFVSFEQFGQQLQNNLSQQQRQHIVIIDTCSFILNDIEHFDNPNTIYVLTCGVFLEILQGFNKSTMYSGKFKEDLQKLCKLKAKLESGLVFLKLGRKMRSYWEGYQPSKSCRNCFNHDQPHHKILRDVDSEILRLAHLLNAKIDTFDTTLQKRLDKVHRRINFSY